MFRDIRLSCLIVAVLMLMSVSVHPAMAQVEAKERVDRASQAIEEIRKAGIRCPACGFDPVNGTFGSMGNITNSSLLIRQVDPDGTADSANISGAELVSLPMATMMVRPENYTGTTVAAARAEPAILEEIASVTGPVDSLPEEPVGETGLQDSPAPHNTTGPAKAMGHHFGVWEREFESDPVIQEYFRNVTGRGYRARTMREPGIAGVVLGHPGIDPGANARTRMLAYTYTNVTDGERWVFAAVETLAGDGAAVEKGSVILPREVIFEKEMEPISEYGGRISDFDKDPEVRAYIDNITMTMGYAARTKAGVERFTAAQVDGGMTADDAALVDVATWTYTNISTKERFRFAAGIGIAANGSAYPPVTVIPGRALPMLEADKQEPPGDCQWYTWAWLALAIILLVVAVIVSAIGALTATGVTANGKGYTNFFRPVNPDGQEFASVEELIAREANPPPLEPGPHEPRGLFPELSQTARWGIFLLLMLIVFLILFVGYSFPLVGLALANLAAAIVAVLICEQVVKDGTDRRTLQDRLNPGSWIGVTERDNGQPVLIQRTGGMVLIALNESTENGVRYIWNGTTDPASGRLPSLISYRDEPGKRVRIWLMFLPEDTPTLFSARYVRADDPAGPAAKDFTVGLIPLSFDAGNATTPTRAAGVGHGISLAIDNRTDRMHVAYLDYSGRWDQVRLMYRTGFNGKWDPPVVVDDTVTSAPMSEGYEMARKISLALDPDGNPRISYMHWKSGYLKYARYVASGAYACRQPVWNCTAEDPFCLLRPPERYENATCYSSARWEIETVDSSSAYAGWGPSLAIDREGNPHIAYLWQGAYTWRPAVRYAHRDADGWTRETVRNGVTGQPDEYKLWEPNVMDGTAPSLALDSAGRPHITFADYGDSSWAGERSYPNMQLEYASRDGPGWVIEDVDRDKWQGELYTRHGLYSSLAMDSSDHPHIAYFSHWDDVCFNLPGYPFNHPPFICDDYLLGNLKYATSNGSVWTTEVVDNSNNAVGRSTSLWLDHNDHPHVSYMDWKNGYVRYAGKHGMSWSRYVVYPGDLAERDSGRFTSLVLDSTGAPHVVFMNARGGFWKYVRADLSPVVFPTPTPLPTTTGAPSPTPTVSPAPTESPTGTPTLTPAPTPTPTVSPAPTGTVSPGPTPTLTVTPTILPTRSPTITPRPTGPPKPRPTKPAPTPTRPPGPIPPPVTTNPRTGGSGTVSGDPAGSLAVTAPGTPAGTGITYHFGTPSAPGAFTVRTVTVMPGQAVPESRCTIRQESPLPDFRLQGGPALYTAIDVAWINPSAIAGGRISFGVSENWLDANHIDPADVVLMRQHDLRWEALPTTSDYREGGRYYYTASTPGFSYFAVTDRATARAVTPAPVTPAPAITPAPVRDTQVSTPAVNMTATPPAPAAARPAAVVPRATETPVPAPVADNPDPGIPLLWIAAAVLAALAGTAGFLIGRRLWWQYQNPALFRDY